MNCPCFVIHRAKDKEREYLVQNLQSAIPTLQVFDGLEGSLFCDLPNIDPESAKPVSTAVLGCGMSHLSILHTCLKEGHEQVCIFEDDAILKKDISSLLTQPLQGCDIYFLGVSEMIKGIPHFTTPGDWRTWTHFEILQSSGAFGYILTRKAIEAIFATFMKGLQQGFFYPFDNLMNLAIKEHSLKALVPREHFVDYQKGLYSYLSNRVR